MHRTWLRIPTGRSRSSPIPPGRKPALRIRRPPLPPHRLRLLLPRKHPRSRPAPPTRLAAHPCASLFRAADSAQRPRVSCLRNAAALGYDTFPKRDVGALCYRAAFSNEGALMAGSGVNKVILVGNLGKDPEVR